jgi:hypothetical protein
MNKVDYTVYRVYDGWKGLEVEEAHVIRESEDGRKLKFGGRTGLAFGCRVYYKGPPLPRTPLAAWHAYIKEQLADIKHFEREIAQAKKNILKAQRAVR